MKLTQGDKSNKHLEIVDSIHGIHRLRVGYITSIENDHEVTKWLEEDYEYKPEISDIRNLLTEAIKLYDSSDRVNIFYVNEMPMWLDKSTRVGLVNTINVQKSMGQETTTLWYGTNKFELNCDFALQFLAQLEIYASSCYNITSLHLSRINRLEDPYVLMLYDITSDYPEILHFNLES